MKRFPLLDSVRFPALRLNQLPLLREIRWDNPTIEKVPPYSSATYTHPIR